MRLPFTKMHGLGNDFMVVDATRTPVPLSTEQIQRMADRHRGVGFDQLLVVDAPPSADVDFGYRIFNADGSEVEQCGNGARCFARFVRQQGLTDKDSIRVATRAGRLQLHVLDEEHVEVDMGVPTFEPAAIPFSAAQRQARYDLEVDGARHSVGAVSLGNPHCVLQVEDCAQAPVAELGARIERHPRFPVRVNVGFMEILDRGAIRLRVFERGAGETQACGSGACAAVAVGRLWGLLNERVAVELPGGRLMISWDGESQAIFLAGPAETVYEGSYFL